MDDARQKAIQAIVGALQRSAQDGHRMLPGEKVTPIAESVYRFAARAIHDAHAVEQKNTTPGGPEDVITWALEQRTTDRTPAPAKAALIMREFAFNGYGCVRIPIVGFKGPDDTDASSYRAAADRLDGGYEAGGSNVKHAIAQLLRSAADAVGHRKASRG